MDFKKLIYPMAIPEFIDTFFEKKPLFIKRENKDYYSNISKDFNLNNILFSTYKEWGEVQISRSDMPYENCPYVKNPPSIQNLNKAFSDKYTVTLNDLQNKSSILYAICREVEKNLFSEANANLYLTGPNSQGLQKHYDDYDVFVLQISGSKLWKIYGKGNFNPVRSAYSQDFVEKSQLMGEYILEAGDFLYLPKGTPHQAENNSTTASLHLTLSVKPIEWVDYFKQLFNVAMENNACFQSSINRKFLSQCDFPEINDVADFLISLIKNPDIQAKAKQLCVNEFFNRKKIHGTSLNLIDIPAELTYGTLLTRNSEQMIHTIKDTKNKNTFYYIGGKCSVNDDYLEAINFIEKHDSFWVNELPFSAIDEKIKFAEFLVSEGLYYSKSICNKNEDNIMKHICAVCGYIYDDTKQDTIFTDLSPTWVCPDCMVGKHIFQPYPEFHEHSY